MTEQGQQTSLQEWELWVDGSGTTADKPCAAGYVLAQGGKIVVEGGVYLGKGSNNFAEIKAVGAGLRAFFTLEKARGKTPEEIRRTPITIYSDSEFTLGAINPHSNWHIRAENLAKLVSTARWELKKWPTLSLCHVDGHVNHAFNERADRLAKAARKAEGNVSEFPEKEKLAQETELVFIDTETSGLNAKRHQILEIALIVTSPNAREIREEFHTKILLSSERIADQSALQVNGHAPYDPAWQAQAMEMRETLDAIDKIFPKYGRLVAHNVSFDERFFLAAYDQGGKKPPIRHPQSLCTMKLSKPLKEARRVPDGRLKSLCEYFGVKNEGEHTALGDVRALHKVFPLLLDELRDMQAEQENATP